MTLLIVRPGEYTNGQVKQNRFQASYKKPAVIFNAAVDLRDKSSTLPFSSWVNQGTGWAESRPSKNSKIFSRKVVTESPLEIMVAKCASKEVLPGGRSCMGCRC